LLARQRDKEGKENRNDRIIAVAEASVVYSEVTALADLSPTMLTQIEQFFVNYQKVREIEITVLGRDGQQAAKNLLERALIAGRK
jgi:inorganic pyrophosphatase